MIINYKSFNMLFKIRGHKLYLSFEGANDFRDLGAIFAKENKLNIAAIQLLRKLRPHTDFHVITQVEIHGHSMGAVLAAYAGKVFIDKGYNPKLVFINGLRKLGIKESLYITKKSFSYWHVYRNCWLNLFQKNKPYIGLMQWDPEPDWKFWTSYKDHLRSRLWGD